MADRKSERSSSVVADLAPADEVRTSAPITRKNGRLITRGKTKRFILASRRRAGRLAGLEVEDANSRYFAEITDRRAKTERRADGIRLQWSATSSWLL